MDNNAMAANGDGLHESKFAGEIYGALMAAQHSADNVIVSPLLLEAMLALLYLGSDGATAEQLRRALQLDLYGSNAKMANYFAAQLGVLTADAQTHCQLTNRLCVPPKYAIAEEFQKIARKYFQTTASCGEPDAAATPAVGQGEGEATLLTAAKFRYKWFLPFSAYRTGLYEFHVDSAVRKAVPMLFDDDMFVKFGEFRELDARAIELPYEHDDELAMLLVLPNRRDGLPALLPKLVAGNTLSALADRMQMESVQVLLPKFKIDFQLGLRDCLQQLGITSLFSAEANFANMLQESCTERLRLADIVHQVSIEVNESGTEEASASVSKPIVISNAIDSRQKFYRADHPFFFAIRNGDTTHFVGHVARF